MPVFIPSFTSRLIYSLLLPSLGKQGSDRASGCSPPPTLHFARVEIIVNNSGQKLGGPGDSEGITRHYRIVFWEAAKSPMQGDNYTW